MDTPQKAKKIIAKLTKRTVNAIRTYNMIQSSDCVVAAVSGGKDSLTMLNILLRVQKALSAPFTLKALHVIPDFEGCARDPHLESLFNEWNVEYELLHVPILARLKPGKTMNCYWCATQRRMELLAYARKHGFSSIALGHHLEDVLESLFMNMIYQGEFSTMMPVMQYRHYPQKVIRPLCMVKEGETKQFAEQMGLTPLLSVCPFGKTSNRLVVRKAIEMLAEQGDFVKENIYRSMSNINMDYLPKSLNDQGPSKGAGSS